MRDRTLVTGFLPFGVHSENPSALLAETCGRPFELLEVSFVAADAFLDRLSARAGSFDRLLMLGLRGGGTGIDLEHVARNYVGPDPDVRGETRGPGPIDPSGPDVRLTTLVAGAPDPEVFLSHDAGCYLCNYIYYGALQRFPDKRVGFVHVPPAAVIPLAAQLTRLTRLIERVERVT